MKEGTVIAVAILAMFAMIAIGLITESQENIARINNHCEVKK